jgi:hypothetical protein
MAENAPEEIATVRIELFDTEPLIWREVEVPTSITLKGLHGVIQAAMGWYDQHLWEFRLGRQAYGQPVTGDDGWGGPPPMRADKTVLADLLRPRKTVLEYLYDFGDSWEHRLIVSRVRPGEPDVLYPRFVAGEHPAPPEDCGGLPGFYASLEALADPGHPDHEDAADWLDGYDPARFEELRLKMAVARLATRRRAQRGRGAKAKPDG